MNGTSGQIVVLQQITNYSLNNFNQLPLTVQYTNYDSGVIANNFNTDLLFSLTFITGVTPTWTGGPPSINNWKFYTGVDFNNLETLPYTDGQYYISGGGEFQPNNFIAMRIDHNTGIVGDCVELLISGNNIFNAQSGLIFN